MNRNRVNKKRMGGARVRWQDRRGILLLHRHPRMRGRAAVRAAPIREVQAALAVRLLFPMEV